MHNTKQIIYLCSVATAYMSYLFVCPGMKTQQRCYLIQRSLKNTFYSFFNSKSLRNQNKGIYFTRQPPARKFSLDASGFFLSNQ